MNTGCWHSVLGPPPWPVRQRLPLLQNDRLTVYCETDGRLSLELRSADGTEQLLHETQPLSFEGTGLFIFSVNWEDPKVGVRISGRPVLSRSETSEVFLVPNTEPPLSDEPVATEHPGGRTACERWMAWREKHLQPHWPLRAGRVPVPADHQFLQLRAAVFALKDLAAQARTGKTYFLPLVASLLRGLLYWEEKDGKLKESYNPLLLRLAARADLPLPLFVLPDVLDVPPPLFESHDVELYRPDPPTLRRVRSTQALVDVQAWLQHAFVVKRTPSPPKTDVMTVLQVIAETANRLGGTHFDEGISDHLARLRRTFAFGQDTVTAFLLEVSDVIVALGTFTLTQCNRP